MREFHTGAMQSGAPHQRVFLMLLALAIVLLQRREEERTAKVKTVADSGTFDIVQMRPDLEESFRNGMAFHVGIAVETFQQLEPGDAAFAPFDIYLESAGIADRREQTGIDGKFFLTRRAVDQSVIGAEVDLTAQIVGHEIMSGLVLGKEQDPA